MSVRHLTVIAALTACVAGAQEISQPGIGPGPGVRYATDAFPGFDSEKDNTSPSRKEPKWFAFINGPNRENATDQLAYCRELLAAGDLSKAAKHLDALVREWPTAPEAPTAQLLLGDTLERDQEFEDAFDAYRYLLDFYSLHCDYNKIADKLYELAGILRHEGKTIVFFRFKNTADVRRAFEAAVLRAPGAAWVREALLTIGDLREEEGKDAEAVKVYENLRNLHYDTVEARTATLREAQARMRILREHAYNRERCQETIAFLKAAHKTCAVADEPVIDDLQREALELLEEESWRSTAFYDSRTRTRRSAISAYERFLKDFPDGRHADEAKERLEALSQSTKGKEKE